MNDDKLVSAVGEAISKGAGEDSQAAPDFGSILEIIMTLLQVFQNCEFSHVRERFAEGGTDALIGIYAGVLQTGKYEPDVALKMALSLRDAAKAATPAETEAFTRLLQLNV